MSDIAGHEGQAALQFGCGDQEIGATVANAPAETSPSACNPRVNSENAVTIDLDTGLDPEEQADAGQQQQGEDDTAKPGLVEPSKRFQAGPGAERQARQSK